LHISVAFAQRATYRKAGQASSWSVFGPRDVGGYALRRERTSFEVLKGRKKGVGIRKIGQVKIEARDVGFIDNA
jgi:hypothetical protein